jgi:hypothetical protein
MARVARISLYETLGHHCPKRSMPALLLLLMGKVTQGHDRKEVGASRERSVWSLGDVCMLSSSLKPVVVQTLDSLPRFVMGRLEDSSWRAHHQPHHRSPKRLLMTKKTVAVPV